MSEHTEKERRELEEFLRANDDLFVLLSERLGAAVTANDPKKLSWLVCQVGSYCSLALTILAKMQAVDRNSGNA